MALWTPAEITTALWLDADDSDTLTLDGSNNVEQWDDKSGNDRHASQATSGDRPAYSAADSRIEFTRASSHSLTLASQPFTGTTARTVFAVVNAQTYGSTGGGYFGATNGAGANGTSWDLCIESSAFYIWILGNDYYTPAPSDSTDLLLVAQWESGSSSTSDVWHDGTALSRAGGSSQTINTASGTTYIGATPEQPQTYFDGYIYEIVVVTGTVDSDTRQKIEGYLAHKWGLEANLPADHPYKSTAPSVYEETITETITVSDSNWLAGFNYRRLIEIPATNIDANLTDFPVLVHLSSSCGTGSTDATSVFDQLAADANRKKIALTDFTGVGQLYCEIEKWDDASEEAWLWVRVPTVWSGQSTYLYLYYDADAADNTSWVGDTGDAAAQSVWDSNFEGVWHMAQDPDGDAANSILDSTSNANHGTPVGSMTSADLIDTDYGPAIEFDGTDDYIQLGAEVQLSSDLTITVLARPDSKSISQYVCGDGTSYLTFYSSDEIIYKSQNGSLSRENFVWSTGTWYHLTARIASGSNTPDLFVNNTSLGGDSVGQQSFHVAYIGRYTAGSDIEGPISEFRISSVGRSDAWIKADYYSCFDTLLSIGAETDNLPDAPATVAEEEVSDTITVSDEVEVGSDVSLAQEDTVTVTDTIDADAIMPEEVAAAATVADTLADEITRALEPPLHLALSLAVPSLEVEVASPRIEVSATVPYITTTF